MCQTSSWADWNPATLPHLDCFCRVYVLGGKKKFLYLLQMPLLFITLIIFTHLTSCNPSLKSWKCENESCSVVSDSLQPQGLYSPWNSPGQNTGVGGLSLLQGIFPTQGLNPGLWSCRQILYQLSHKGNHKSLVNWKYIELLTFGRWMCLVKWKRPMIIQSNSNFQNTGPTN